MRQQQQQLLLLVVIVLSSTMLLVHGGAEAAAVSSTRHHHHHHHRHLEDAFSAVDDEYYYYPHDISTFSVYYERCQDVYMFDDDLAANNNDNNKSPLALKHFVLFRLCNDCHSCNVYGRYVTDLETYIANTAAYQEEQLERYCQACQENYNNNCQNNNNDDCTTTIDCIQDCNRYQNLQDAGYVNAADYLECQQLQQQDDDDDNNVAYYIGPRCSKSLGITIGVFYDQDCWEPANDVNAEDLLGAQISYHLIHNNNNNCLSCAEPDKEENNDNEQQDNDAQDLDNVNEMCETLYTAAAKCETPTGLSSSSSFFMAQQQYENQAENEFMACNFINSLRWNSYTQQGEINLTEPQDVILRPVTRKQRVALLVLFLFVVALMAGVEYLRRRIDSVTKTVQLAGSSVLT